MTLLDWLAILGATLLYIIPIGATIYTWTICARVLILYLEQRRLVQQYH